MKSLPQAGENIARCINVRNWPEIEILKAEFKVVKHLILMML